MQAFEFENIISTTHAWVCLLFLLGANISTLTGQGLRAAWCLFPSCIDAKYLRALTPRRGGGVQVTPTSPRLNACRRVAVTLVGSCFLYAQNLNPGAKHVRHKLKGPKLERDPPGPSKPTGISNQVHAAGGRENSFSESHSRIPCLPFLPFTSVPVPCASAGHPGEVVVAIVAGPLAEGDLDHVARHLGSCPRVTGS